MSVLGFDPVVVWGIILAILIGTFAFRVSFIVLFGHLESVPERLERLLQFVAPAALAALAFPALVYVDGTFAITLGNERLVAGGLAAIVAWYTESLLATVVVGMAVYWVLLAVV